MSREGLKNMHPNLLKQSDRLKHFVDDWLDVLGLGAWYFTVDYHGERCEDDPKTNATISCAWEYMNGHINFYLPAFEDYTDLNAESIVVHELVHAIVNELKPANRTDEYQKHEEHAVTHLTKALLALRRKTRDQTAKEIAKQNPQRKPRKRNL